MTSSLRTLTAGRCIGHGGTPVDLKSKSFIRSDKQKGFPALVAVDERERTVLNKTALGHNGYVLVNLNKAVLTIYYYDETQQLITEAWTADIEAGLIKGTIVPPAMPMLQPEPTKSWQDAVAV